MRKIAAMKIKLADKTGLGEGFSWEYGGVSREGQGKEVFLG